MLTGEWTKHGGHAARLLCVTVRPPSRTAALATTTRWAAVGDHLILLRRPMRAFACLGLSLLREMMSSADHSDGGSRTPQGIRCSRGRCKAFGSGSNCQRFCRKAGAIKHEPFRISFCDPDSPVRQPRAEAGDGSLEQRPLTGKPVGLNDSLYGRLDMPHAHGNVPPAEKMFYVDAASIWMRFGRAGSPSEITVNRRPGFHPKANSSSRINTQYNPAGDIDCKR